MEDLDKLKKEIENILTVHNDNAIANENDFELYIKGAAKQLLTIFSKTIDSVIGRQDRKYIYANEIYGIAVRDLRKQMRARKKELLK